MTEASQPALRIDSVNTYSSSPNGSVYPALWVLSSVGRHSGYNDWPLLSEQTDYTYQSENPPYGGSVVVNGTVFKANDPGLTNTGLSVSNGNPAIVTWTGSNFGAGDEIEFTAGTLPSPLALNTPYCVLAAGLTANTFEISTAVPANSGSCPSTTPIATTGSGSGLTAIYGVDAAWGMNFVCQDNTGFHQPGAGCTNEIDNYAVSGVGTDPARTREGLLIATTSNTAGDHFAYGLVLGTGLSTMDRGVGFGGLNGANFEIGADFSTGTYSTAAIFLAAGQQIALDGNGTAFNRSIYYQTGEFVYQTQYGVVAAISDQGTLALAGPVNSILANTATTSAVCYNTSTHLFTYDGTIGTCNTSSERFKHNIEPIAFDALAGIEAMKPVSFDYNADMNTPEHQLGFVAEDLDKIDSLLVGRDDTGQPNSIRFLGPMFAYVVGAEQQMQDEIVQLRARVAQLERTAR